MMIRMTRLFWGCYSTSILQHVYSKLKLLFMQKPVTPVIIDNKHFFMQVSLYVFLLSTHPPCVSFLSAPFKFKTRDAPVTTFNIPYKVSYSLYCLGALMVDMHNCWGIRHMLCVHILLPSWLESVRQGHEYEGPRLLLPELWEPSQEEWGKTFAFKLDWLGSSTVACLMFFYLHSTWVAIVDLC